MRRLRGWVGIVMAGALAAGPAGGAGTKRAAPQASPRPAPAPAPRQVFGPAPARPATRASFARLDGALAQIARRYPGIAAAHALASLRAVNPAARFRLAAPLAVPEVLIDAITTGDPRALASALQNLGLRDGAVFANDVGGWLPGDQI